MGLKEYRSKRDLTKTPEPASGSRMASNELRFCVQKHAARRLHYDFRLEFRGVLVSWAIPKGPSMNPADKRLAIQVEDHPLDYQYFEGVIPKGNYGAGTVEIWDHGTYTALDARSPEETEKALAKGLKEGHFAFILHGEKLNGEFVLQKLKKDFNDPSWLLIKKGDSFAKPDEDSDEEEDERKSQFLRTGKSKKKVKIPDFISPMLATLIREPFDNEDWLFEIKWDGYRALAFIEKGKVQLKSRNKNLLNSKYPAIVHQLEKITSEMILDGELVVLNSEGISKFQLMQNYQKEGKGALCFYVFDLLFKDGMDLRELPLIERKEILRKFLKEMSLDLILYSDHIFKEGKAFFNEASKKNLEGIIGKKISSTYESKRSPNWVKIKTEFRQEFVICGFTEPRGTRKKFGALIVGYYDQEKLKYAGHVGGGFDAKLLQGTYDKLKPLIQKKSPFAKIPKTNETATWVKPTLICEVSFREWTNENTLRMPIFQGLRMDKEPKSVIKEVPSPSPVIASSKSRKRKELSLTNLEKVYWPKEGYTKGDLIKYYEQVSTFILPYLKDRPIVMHRYPNGIESEEFYQKNIDDAHPSWIKTFPIQTDGKVAQYLMIDNLESLLYAINLGSIDLHPFISRYKKIKNPDFCAIDLDPHGVSFQDVIDVALEVHRILEAIDVVHYCKTSGGKGLHILIPFHAKYDYEQSRQFAEIISYYVHQKFPDLTSMIRNPKKREKKIYLDCLQNRYGQTIVAPYSVRPRPGALVSTPLDWSEVNHNLVPQDFNIETVPNRLKTKGDILKDILKQGINLKTALKNLQKGMK